MNKKTEKKTPNLNASLQVLNGHHIGRVLPLKNPVSQFGKDSTGIITITKKEDGYYIASTKEISKATINHKPLDNKPTLLNENDMIVIDNIPLQFFFNN